MSNVQSTADFIRPAKIRYSLPHDNPKIGQALHAMRYQCSHCSSDRMKIYHRMDESVLMPINGRRHTSERFAVMCPQSGCTISAENEFFQNSILDLSKLPANWQPEQEIVETLRPTGGIYDEAGNDLTDIVMSGKAHILEAPEAVRNSAEKDRVRDIQAEKDREAYERAKLLGPSVPVVVQPQVVDPAQRQIPAKPEFMIPDGFDLIFSEKYWAWRMIPILDEHPMAGAATRQRIPSKPKAELSAGRKRMKAGTVSAKRKAVKALNV
jgi:hypothetical protein